MSPHSAVVVVAEKVGGATMRVSGVGSSTVETSDIRQIQAAAEMAPLAPIWAVKSKVKLSRAGAGMMGPKVEAIYAALLVGGLPLTTRDGAVPPDIRPPLVATAARAATGGATVRSPPVGVTVLSGGVATGSPGMATTTLAA